MSCSPSGFAAGRDSWSPEEDQILVAMRKKGKTHQQIAEAVGRTAAAVSCRLVRLLRLAEKSAMAAQQKVRNCMCCGKSFMSAGPHNRMCMVCRRQDVSPYATF